MPFALTSAPSTSEISEAINYLLGNFGANISADPNSGEITGPTGNVIGYLYKYLAVKYADSADGALNFSNSPTNRLYYGIRNSNQEIESTNPTDYIWREVDGGFGTTKFLFYKVTGGRQIEFFVGTTAPGYAWQQTPSSSIDLDAISVVITATASIYQWTTSSTPPARPTVSTTYTWATGAYTAPAGWDVEAPSNTTPGAFLWEISITLVQTGGLDASTLDWPNPIYAIRASAYNGTNGAAGANGATGNSALTAYRVQDQASATPTFTTPTSGPNAPSGWTLSTPTVAVGQVLWYIQGEYNSSTTLTINGVAPNTTRWTGPIAASVFQDIRSDNWNGSNPPSFGSPDTWGTAGYYISRSSGTAILNNLGARGTLQSGSSPAISGSTMTGAGAVINSNGTFAVGDSVNNITYNGTTINLNGQIVAAQNLNVNQLSAISANLGTITAGSISGTTLSVGSSPTLSGTTMTGSGALVNSNGTFALGNPITNISFDGTQMTLNGSVVATQNIDPNAVTIPISASTDSSISIPKGTYTSIQSISYSIPDSVAFVISLSAIPIGAISIYSIRLRRNSTLVFETSEIESNSFNGFNCPPVSITVIDNAPPGVGEYTFEIRPRGGTSSAVSATYGNRVIAALGSKR